MAKEELAKKSKEKFYRGKEVGELKKLDIREFAKLVKSSPRRAILRNYDVVRNFVFRCNARMAKNRPIRTHKRDMIVVPAMLGWSIGVHNGKEFVKVDVNEEMLGHRLGEFSPTRKIAKHTTIGKRVLKK